LFLIFSFASSSVSSFWYTWGTMLQEVRSRVRFQMRSLEFFSLPNTSSRAMALGSTQPVTEMSTRNLPGGGSKVRPARHLWADCLENVGASTSHNPVGLHGLLQGELYLLHFLSLAFILKIWGSHICGCEVFYLVGYNAMQSVESKLTFRMNMSLPSLGSKNKPGKKPAWKVTSRTCVFPLVYCLASSSTLKMEATYFSETSVDFQWTTRCYITEDRKNSSFLFEMCWSTQFRGLCLQMPSISHRNKLTCERGFHSSRLLDGFC
jgi:hypothetical protein